MFVQRPTLQAGESWESDRGVRAEIYAVSGQTVVFELVGTSLGCTALDRGLFQRIFRNPFRGAPERPPPLPDTRRAPPAWRPTPLARPGTRV
jgi:hypothetical protein